MGSQMDKNEIETFVFPRINEAIVTAIQECVVELNSKGFRFEPVDDFIQEWIDPDSGFQLYTGCTLVVHVSDEPDPITVEDPVMDSFYARIDSGSDPEAEMLNLMEGDISNGGFNQLYDNKGVDFIKEAALLLEKIGSTAALKLVRQALVLIEQNVDLIRGYDRFCKDLYHLDEKYYDMKENPTALFEKYRGGTEGA